MNILAYTAEQQNNSVLLTCSDGRQLSMDWRGYVF